MNNESTASRIRTPFGVLRLRAWGTEGASVLFQIVPVLPTVPSGMRVDGCVAAVWRVAAARRLAGPTQIGCQWVTPPGEGHPESGESLLTMTWERPDIAIAIGTEDP